MSIDRIIIILMVIFMAIGALDRMSGGALGRRIGLDGLSEQFEEGVNAMGALAMSMVGFVVLAPVLKNVLSPIVVPIYRALGADPAMFATTLLANDMGGYPLAMEMAQDPQAGLLAGNILGAMLGPTIVFTIPVALGIINKSDQRYLATGVLCGIVTIPLGVLVGGLVAGFPIGMILRNLIPIIIVAALIIAGLALIPEKMIRGFSIFGKGVVILATLGLVLGALDLLLGWKPIASIGDVREGIAIVGQIALTLAGAFVLVAVITKVFKGPLMKMGHALGMNDIAAAGMVATLANSIPMFGMMKNMDTRGKILNVAFAVSAAFVFGDHLGFTAGVQPTMLVPMIVGKLVAGITAVAVAIYMANRMSRKNPELFDQTGEADGDVAEILDEEVVETA